MHGFAALDKLLGWSSASSLVSAEYFPDVHISLTRFERIRILSIKDLKQTREIHT